MSDFLELFSYEINAKVLSFISQSDCLEAMRVCRTWFDLIPSFATELWQNVDMRSQVLKKNDCLLRCLGPNVQKIDMKYTQMNSVLQEFEKHDINIHSLRIFFCNCFETNFNNLGFFKLLKSSICLNQLSTLKLLSDFPANISLLEIADACPLLTHLTVYLHDYLVKPVPSSAMLIKENDDPPKQLNQLVFLHLDARFLFRTKMEPFLRLCPQLQVFMASGRSGFDKQDNDQIEGSVLNENIQPPFSETPNYMDFVHLLNICPELQVINWDDTQAYTRVNDDIFLSNLTHDLAPTLTATSGLQTFRMAYDRPNRAESVVAAIERCKDTLTLLKIHQQEAKPRLNFYAYIVMERSDYALDPDSTLEDWSGLSKVTLVRIKDLDISILTDNLAIHFAQFLSNHQHQNFGKINLTFRSQRLLTKRLIKILNETNVDHLSIKIQDIALYTIPEHLDVDDDVESIYGLLPRNFDTLARHPGLKDIRFYNIPISDQALLALGNNRGLEKISLISPNYRSNVATLSKEGLFDYASTNINEALECLELSSVAALDDDALVALSRIQSLHSLDITHCINVSDKGLKNFIDKMDPATFKRLDTSFYGCPLITKEGILYVQSKTTENSIMYFP